MSTRINREMVTRFAVATVVAVISILAQDAAYGQPCGEWTNVATTGPSARLAHAMAYDSARSVTLLFGGADSSGYVGDTWEWDGVQWTRVATTGPSPRYEHAMAYDSARGVTVLFGGYDGSSLGDTWEWDGLEWTQVATTGPSARHVLAMAYDSARGVTVLFGGYDDYNRLGDTWEWDGVQWTQVATSGPPVRVFHAMAYDSGRSVTILFGGWNGSYLGDTWEWDGLRWTRDATTGPSARRLHAMAYNSAWGVIVLFGGYDGSSLGDTWQWNGVQWTDVTTTGPSARYYHAITYDSTRSVTVLFGGSDGTSRGDTWERRQSFWLVSHPQDLTVPRGEAAVFAVDVGGPDPVSYQWRRDGTPLVDGGNISGSTTDTLTISRAFCGDTGLYDCVVTGDCGQITSRSARLTVLGDTLLTVTPTCPNGGAISVNWRCASPNGTVALIFALNQGHFTIPPSYPCAGTRLDLGANQIQIAWQGSAGPDGARTINGSAGPAACGGFMQLLDLDTCTTSNVELVD